MFTNLVPGGRAVRFAAAIAATLALGACAKDQNADASGFGAGGAATPGRAQDFVVNVGDRVFFETDSTDLTSTGTATLDKQVGWLQRYPRYTFTVEGHADERGTREYNLALGERRANAAKNYLVSLGVDAGRITTVSYGKERPVALGSDEESWARNRRAVTVTID